jgi:hypothetical protein
MKKIALNNKEDYKDSQGRLIKRLKCSTENCTNHVSDRGDYKISGKCRQCSKRKKPFLTQWKRLFRDWRKLEVLLTYEEFLIFTKIKDCHYCKNPISWKEYTSVNNKNSAYYLDRKDNNKGYSSDNCVVCCTRCNRMRSNKFTYEEFLLFSPILIQIERQRNE